MPHWSILFNFMIYEELLVHNILLTVHDVYTLGKTFEAVADLCSAD